MKIARYTVLAIGLLSFVSMGANAQRSDSIAAVVNGDVITYTDVYDRMDLILKSSGLPNTKEFKAKLLPQILNGLITEEVQLQEANRLGLTVSQDEINEGFASLSGQNKLKADQFKTILKRQKVQIPTLEKQIEAQLAWGKVVQREIRPRIQLSDRDIKAELARLKKKEGQKEYFVAEIFLPLNVDTDEAEVHKVATDLANQLQKDVQKFPAAARQFSQSATAAAGGIIGWITSDQLGSDIESTLKTMAKNQISQPIKNDEGYTILFLRDSRIIQLGDSENEEKLRIKMAIFELTNNQSDREDTLNLIQEFRRDVKGCLDILKQTARLKNVKLDELYDTVKNIPSAIVTAVEYINIGEVGENLETDKNVTVPMLCGRDGSGKSNALETEIENRLGTQRMDILQKRYLRDLISDAYIERRV